jgi:hypothetical protein
VKDIATYAVIRNTARTERKANNRSAKTQRVVTVVMIDTSDRVRDADSAAKKITPEVSSDEGAGIERLLRKLTASALVCCAYADPLMVATIRTLRELCVSI